MEFYLQKDASLPRERTQPKSPKFATAYRNQFKTANVMSIEQSAEKEADLKSAREFKARPLPKKLLTSVSKLPQVSKRDRTEIQEFSLSRTNKGEKEVPSESNNFKARPLDKKILEVQQFKPILDRSAKTEMSPFNLNVDERAKSRTKEIS